MRDSCQTFGVRRRGFPLARLDVGLLGLALTAFRAFHLSLFLNLGVRFVSCLPHFLPRAFNDRHPQIVLCRTIESSLPLCVESDGRKQVHCDVIAKSVQIYRDPILEACIGSLFCTCESQAAIWKSKCTRAMCVGQDEEEQ